jgi:hypothetical protein
MIKCACPLCGGRVEYPSHEAGRHIYCPHCGFDFPLFAPDKLGNRNRQFSRRAWVASTVAAGVALIAIIAFSILWPQHQKARAIEEIREPLTKLIVSLETGCTMRDVEHHYEALRVIYKRHEAKMSTVESAQFYMVGYWVNLARTGFVNNNLTPDTRMKTMPLLKNLDEDSMKAAWGIRPVETMIGRSSNQIADSARWFDESLDPSSEPGDIITTHFDALDNARKWF